MWYPLGVVAIDPKLVVGLRQQSAKRSQSGAPSQGQALILAELYP